MLGGETYAGHMSERHESGLPGRAWGESHDQPGGVQLLNFLFSNERWGGGDNSSASASTEQVAAVELRIHVSQGPHQHFIERNLTYFHIKNGVKDK